MGVLCHRCDIFGLFSDTLLLTHQSHTLFAVTPYLGIDGLRREAQSAVGPTFFQF